MWLYDYSDDQFQINGYCNFQSSIVCAISAQRLSGKQADFVHVITSLSSREGFQKICFSMVVFLLTLADL